MVNSLYIFNPDTLRRKAATRNKVCGFPDLQQLYLQNLGGAYIVIPATPAAAAPTTSIIPNM